MRGALIAASALLALCAPAQADETRIAASWDEGLAEAQRRNVPIVVILQKDGAQPFVNLLQQPALAQPLGDRAVVIVGHRPGGHEPARRVDRRERREVEYCPLYLTIECRSHDEVYNTYAGRFDYEELPAAFVCRPDGRAVVSGVERLAPPAIMEKVNETQVALGEGVFRSEVERLERKLLKGDEKLADGKQGPARKIFEGELEDARKPLLRAACEQRLEQLDARALELIEEARAREGKPRSDALHRIEREMRGRAPGERAAEVLRELEAS